MGGRVWRGQKLGSQDFGLHERSEVDSGRAEGDGEHDGGAAVVEYRTYKRRWLGLAQLMLMNIVVSWDVSWNQHPSSHNYPAKSLSPVS